MAKKIIFTGILAIALVLGMTAVGCDNGSTGGGDSLKGTSWSRKYTSELVDATYTLKFTSDEDMEYNTSGWTKSVVTGKKTNHNQTTKGTYIYSSILKEGVVTCSAFTNNKFVFEIVGKEMRSLTGSTVYTKK